MNFTRRRVLACAGAIGIASTHIPSFADTYPSRPIRLVVAYPPGGSLDTIARLLANDLSKQLNVSVVVENRPGGNSIIATQYIANSPADGYRLFLTVAQPYAINPTYYKSLSYDPQARTAIAPVAELPWGICVSATSPFKSLKDLVEYAKVNPEKLNYGAPGALAPPCLALESFAYEAGIRLTQVPYQGGAAVIQALLGGQVDLVMNDLTAAAGFLSDGQLRLLVVTPRKVADFPQVPTFAEAGYPNLQLPMGWVGLFGPAGLPAEIVSRLSDVVGEAIRNPAIVRSLSTNAMVAMSGTAAELETLLTRDIRIYGETMERLGLKGY